MAANLTASSTRKIVVLGAGFLGSHITRTLAQNPANHIQLTSRNPKPLYDALLAEFSSNDKSSMAAAARGSKELPIPSTSLLAPHFADITDRASLVKAFEGASVVISLVGVLTGTREKFETIQWRGVQNVISAVKEVNFTRQKATVLGATEQKQEHIAKVIHISAIGADPNSPLDYFRTKALAEMELFQAFGQSGPSVTVIRPSLVFGKGDGFFERFATLSKYMPFLPVFGGGLSLFQPVFAGDIGRAVEILSKTEDDALMTSTRNTVIQAGGPDVFTYRQLMELILKHTGRSRPIVSLPFAVGKMQGMVLERLPENILTVTQSQVEQLKLDSIVLGPDRTHSQYGEKYTTLAGFVSQVGGESARGVFQPLMRLDDVLPMYL